MRQGCTKCTNMSMWGVERGCVFTVTCEHTVKGQRLFHLSLLFKSCFFIPHAMYPVLIYLNVDFFNRFLHAFPFALILMRKIAFLSIELLTITILGKVSLLASGSICAGPVGHSWTAG